MHKSGETACTFCWIEEELHSKKNYENQSLFKALGGSQYIIKKRQK